MDISLESPGLSPRGFLCSLCIGASGSLAREKALADLTYMMENRSPAAMM
jgi:hypothetical protein